MIVYTIVRKSTSEVVYVGSTHQPLCDRKANHHYNYTKRPLPVHFMMQQNGGWEDYEFQIYSEHPEITRQELKIIEGNAIHALNPSYNIQKNPYRTGQDIKTYYAQYYQDNTEKIRSYSKEWASQRFICDCGSDVRWGEKARHLKSIKHAAYET